MEFTESNEALEKMGPWEELENFEAIAKYVSPSPGDLPELPGIDVFGKTVPLSGNVGGDHIIYVDFKKRYDLEARIAHSRRQGQHTIADKLESCRHRCGIAVADVSGHRITDALMSAMLHQAFLLGAIYELDFFGEITTRLFENLNTRFYKSSAVSKFITLLYGELSENGTFRFISAAHPLPVVFSRQYQCIVDICTERIVTFPPIGTIPSYDDIDRETAQTVLGFKQKYEVNEISLMGSGDILLLFTDGLAEHSNGEQDYFPSRLEAKLREVKDLSAREIYAAIQGDIFAFAPPEDDLTLVILKRN